VLSGRKVCWRPLGRDRLCLPNRSRRGCVALFCDPSGREAVRIGNGQHGAGQTLRLRDLSRPLASCDRSHRRNLTRR
jgi:hypothetical protein